MFFDKVNKIISNISTTNSLFTPNSFNFTLPTPSLLPANKNRFIASNDYLHSSSLTIFGLTRY